MPRIQGYERQYGVESGAPNRQAQASDFGGTGATELGHGIQSAGQDAAFAQRQLQAASTQRTLTDVHSALSMFRTEFFKQAEEVERTADPSDTKVGDRWLLGESGEGDPGSVKHILDSYREHIEDPVAQQAFDRGAADIVEHFSGRFVTFQAKLAGEHAKQSYSLLVDNAQNDAERHPEATDFILRNLRTAIESPDGPYGRLPTEQRRQLLENAERSTQEFMVRGEIRKNPLSSLEDLRNGKWDEFLNAEKKVALVNAAESEIHVQQVEARRLAAEAKNQLIEVQHQTDQTLMAKYAAHQANPANKQFPALTAMEISNELKAGRLDGSVGRAMLNMLDSDAREKTLKSDNATYWDLFQRVHLPWGDKRKITSTADIYDAAAKRKLTPENVKNLVKEFHDSRSEDGSIFGREKAEFLKRIEPQITKPGPFGVYADPTTPEQFYRFQQDVETALNQYGKIGKDPRELLDPTNKNYLGRREFLDRYQNKSFGGLTTAPRMTPPAQAVPAPGTPAQPAKPKKSLDDIFGFKK